MTANLIAHNGKDLCRRYGYLKNFSFVSVLPLIKNNKYKTFSKAHVVENPC